MRLGTALLCDAATVREGLLHVLGGGISRVGRPAFPAPLGVPLAVQLLMSPSEVTEDIKVDIELDRGELRVAGFTATLTGASSDPEISADEDVQLSMTLPTNNLVLPEPGLYRLRISVNGHELGFLIFTVRPLTQPTAI